MAEVKIYTTLFCPFCWRAKALLKEKGVDFEEIDVTLSPGARRRMIELAEGRQSVPQIFIDGRPIGGSDELEALEAAGELDAVLEAA
ncbi:MAG: glutaredoxin 3 [Alphaproteobacteria bacterium]